MIVFQKRIYREDLKANPSVNYVFGDNCMRIGMGGQAGEMRGEPNAFGVATLRAPGDFWSDRDLRDNSEILATDFIPLLAIANAGGVIVLPLDGVGTGIAQLEVRAPKTFSYLQKLWNHLIETGSK